MRRGPIRNASSDAFFAWDGEVLAVNIQVVCGHENGNQQLRIRTPKKLPVVLAQPLA